MSGPWRVGLLGAGMMAQGFDEPDAPRVLSMAHAFSRSSRFTIGGFYDAREDRAALAESRWHAPPSPRERRRWLAAGWDVIYIATPDAQHGADLRDALACRPRAVLVEKPLSTDGAEALALLEQARRSGVLVMVNYPRRWHSATARLVTMARDGKMSPPSSAFVAVSGGVVHNLPHAIDFIHAVWGGTWTIEPAGGAAAEMPVVWWRRGSQAFAMAVTETAAHYLWEMHLYTAEGKLELSRSPEVLTWSVPAPHSEYSGFNVLTPVFDADMEAEPLLCRAVDALAAALDDPAIASVAMRREVESQEILSAAFRCFSQLT